MKSSFSSVGGSASGYGAGGASGASGSGAGGATITKLRTAAEILEEAGDTYRERNKVYGDNFLRVGAALAAQFPDGLTIKTAADWNRIHMFLLAQVKLSRYATNFNKGGHQDSVRDAAVYCAMLEMIDEMVKTNGKDTD